MAKAPALLAFLDWGIWAGLTCSEARATSQHVWSSQAVGGALFVEQVLMFWRREVH